MSCGKSERIQDTGVTCTTFIYFCMGENACDYHASECINFYLQYV